MRALDESESLSPHLVNIDKKIKTDGAQYSFLGLRHYLETAHKLKIIVAPSPDVPVGGAVGGLVEDGQRYIILVNEQDYAQEKRIVRFRIAHELGHIACGHVAELDHMAEMGIGDASNPDTPYVVLRNVQEDEADVVAATLYYAYGEVVERRIPTETDFTSEIGDLKISQWEGEDDANAVDRDSVLNHQDNRRLIRDTLRKNGYIRPPVAILCQTLRPFLHDRNGKDVRKLSELVHKKYRQGLGEFERKPTGIVCGDCPDTMLPQCRE